MATKKYINLLQSHEPLMDSGDYEITVKQTLEVALKSIDETFAPTKRKFSVFGERFFLEPGSVHSVYPPAGSLGDHSNTFPHIILNRSTLPWERSVDGQRNGIWLALLLFEQTEAPDIQTVTMAEYRDNLGLQVETGDGPAEQPITVIDVETELLKKIMPSRADLNFTAHSRRETGNAQRGNVQVIGPERAVVIGNRLPKADGNSTVHLISLENRFPDDGEFDFSKKNADGSIRLVSLKSWSFTSRAAKFSLFGMLEHLNRSPSVLARPYLNDQVLALRMDTLEDRSAYRFQTTATGTQWTNDEFDNFRQFDESSHLSVEVPDTGIDADSNPQLDPFPDPTAFTIAVELRGQGGGEVDRFALLGKVDDGKYKPSLWYLPSIRGIEYRVSGEDGTLFSGRIPGLLQDHVFTKMVWLKSGSEFRFFVNGYLAHTAPAPGRMFTNDSPYLIGKVDEPEGAAPNFFGQMKRLEIFRRALTEAEARDALTSEASSNGPMVNDYLGRGMLPLPHQLRKGKRAVSWYRGPLSVRSEKPGFALPAVSADQLLVLDQTSGMWDVSYAAAWQLGRLMALEDRQFSLELFKWKRQMSMRAKSASKKPYLPFRQMQDDSVPKVTLFRNVGFAGEQRVLTENWTGFDNGQITAWNDRIRSIKIDVPAGWEVEIFQHVNFVGDKKTISGQWDGAGDPVWTSQISSIKIISPLEKRIRDWMRKRHLLEQVPFHYLVPEEAMLPNESLRFFNIDPMWVACLKDGAASIGRTSSADFELDKLENLADDSVAEMSGFLVRSELVAGYPGLQVLGYAQIFGDDDNPDPDTALPMLRREKLSDDVLLCIFEGNVGTVDFFQKPDVLHFGLDSGTGPDGKEIFAKQLRKANGANVDDAAPSFKLSSDEPPRHYDPDLRVFNFAKMAVDPASSLQQLLRKVLTTSDFEEFDGFTSADFALQMLEGAERVRFVRK